MPQYQLSLLLMLLLVGCASATTHYYVLDAHNRHIQAKPGTAIIALKLSIPRYLDRAQLVSRTETHQLLIAENHQWAGQLHENIARVLSDDLSGLLRYRVLPMPLYADLHADGTLLVDIHRFERMADGHLRLDAVWHMFRHGKRIHSGSVSLASKQTFDSRDYAEIANTMSRLLDHMAADIAQKLEHLPDSAR